MKKSGCDGCSRRSVLKGLGIAALGPFVLQGCQPGSNLPTGTATTSGSMLTIDVTLTANAVLAMAGGALLIDSDKDTLVVIRESATTVIALSAVCTHAGCLIDFDVAGAQLTCPCHGSIFSESGAVVQGPANSPLASYAAALSGTTISVTL